MKLKTIERIRALEITIPILTSVLSSLYGINGCEEVTQFISNFGINQNNLKELNQLISYLYDLDIITHFYTQTKTDEYKEMKFLYDKVISNTATLTKTLNFNDPVQIFALYVYLYRKGYLSYGKYFEYANNMKDFAKLGGIDVMRGSGVCRSISSLLTDIYSNLGFKATNLLVKATENSCHNQQKLSTANLNVDSNSNSFVKLILILTKILPLANHQITMVTNENNNFNYIFDPTNDGYLKKGNLNRIELPNFDKSYMKILPLEQLFVGMMGMSKMELNLYSLYKNLKLPSISDNDYQKKYLQALKICVENTDILDQFYKQNKKLYEDIYLISEEQRNLIERIVPLIPKKHVNVKRR